MVVVLVRDEENGGCVCHVDRNAGFDAHSLNQKPAHILTSLGLHPILTWNFAWSMRAMYSDALKRPGHRITGRI